MSSSPAGSRCVAPRRAALDDPGQRRSGRVHWLGDSRDEQVGVELAPAHGGPEGAVEGAVGGERQLGIELLEAGQHAHLVALGAPAVDDRAHDVILVGHAQRAVELAQALHLAGVCRLGVLEGGGDAHADPALDQLRHGLDDLAEVRRPAHLVVVLGIGAVQGDLHVHRQVGERLHLSEAAGVEHRRVREHDRGQLGAEGGDQLGHVVERERLTAGDPEGGEAEPLALPGPLDDLLPTELAPIDLGRRLREAVRAAQVAVIVGVEPEPLADRPTRDLLGDGTHARPSSWRRERVAAPVGSPRLEQ